MLICFTINRLEIFIVTPKQFLEELLDEEQVVKLSSLSQLSGLSPPDIGLVMTIWEKFDSNRRVKLLTSIVEMAEDNV